MTYQELITLDHPDTGDAVELKVEFYYSRAERPTLDDPGCPEEFEIASLINTKTDEQYADECIFTDEQVIEELRQC